MARRGSYLGRGCIAVAKPTETSTPTSRHQHQDINSSTSRHQFINIKTSIHQHQDINSSKQRAYCAVLRLMGANSPVNSVNGYMPWAKCFTLVFCCQNASAA